eukprot:221464_1
MDTSYLMDGINQYNESNMVQIVYNEEEGKMNNEEFSNLNFATTLPEPVMSNPSTETKIKEFLSNSGDWMRHWGEPLQIILTSKWQNMYFKEDDEVTLFGNTTHAGDKVTSFGNTIHIKRERNMVSKEIDAKCVAFNELAISQNTQKSICCAVSVRVWDYAASDNNNWQITNYTTYDSQPMDSRQLGSVIYNQLIDKYGQELVIKAHLKSSEISNVDARLRRLLTEIKNVYNKQSNTRPMIKRQQKSLISEVYKTIKDGADPNLIVDFNEYRVLHYAVYFYENAIQFVKHVINNGGDPTLGPITKKIIESEINDRQHIVDCHWTPWYFYKEGGVVTLIPNGPLHNAIGGECGGIAPVVYTKMDIYNAKLKKKRSCVFVCCFLIIMMIIIGLIIAFAVSGGYD